MGDGTVVRPSPLLCYLMKWWFLRDHFSCGSESGLGFWLILATPLFQKLESWAVGGQYL